LDMQSTAMAMLADFKSMVGEKTECRKVAESALILGTLPSEESTPGNTIDC